MKSKNTPRSASPPNPASGPLPDGPVRLARFLAAVGLGSRRGCEELICDGQIRVNGEIVTEPGTNVTPGEDEVTHNDRPVRPAKSVTILLNKPRGYTCSASDAHAEKLVTELFPKVPGRLFTVGRLDRDSEGLVLATNDGALAQSLQHPRCGVRKVYKVTVAGKPPPDVLRIMTKGIEHGGDFLRAESASWMAKREGKVLRIVLTEGKNREIRRLCSALGLTVHRLQRIQYGPLSLTNLRPGRWRSLSAAELANLRTPPPASDL